MRQRTNDVPAIMISIAVHALLMAIFWNTSTTPPPTEQLGFVQVEFGSFSEGRPVQRAEEMRPEEDPAEVPVEDIEEQPPAEATPDDAKPVDLPDQNVTTPENPEVNSPETDIEAIQPEDPEDQQQIEEEPKEEKVVRPLGSGDVAGNAGAETGDQGDGAEENKTAPYNIEGLNRTPVFTQLPAYSEKVNAFIRVRVTVDPKGEIIRQIPLIKGNPRLEQAVMEALQRWRFNPLPPNVPQENQTGIISFRFQLE